MYPAFRLQEAIKAKTLGTARWHAILGNVNRHARVLAYRREHNGRRPAGDFQPVGDRIAQALCCRRRPPKCDPEFIEGIRPAAAARPGGTYGGGLVKREQLDTSFLQVPSQFS